MKDVPGPDRMPLQNRVAPRGDLVAAEGRGLLMGNRGVLHDGARRIVRYARGRRWITCVTSFRGRHRTVMTPGRYTELFFLDEAVALAAGHRPCAECRRRDYERFCLAWAAAMSGRPAPSADAIDHRLHVDRLVAPGVRRTFVARPTGLPDGTFVETEGCAWLLWRGRRRAWSPAGYTDSDAIPGGAQTVLTPRCTVAVLDAGYVVLVHPTAEAAGAPERRLRPRSNQRASTTTRP